MLRAVGALVTWIYARADTLLVQSRGFVASVSRRVRPDKIVYFPNGYCSPEPFEASGRLPPMLEDLLESHECVVFAGNIGRAQAMGTLLDAAAKLLDLASFRLVIVGSGSELQATKDEVARRRIHNVIIAGRLPAALMPEIFDRSVGLLVSLAGDEIFSLTIPSKIQAYLAAGRPVIGSLDGEGARVIEEAQAGWASPAEDGAALALAIRQLMAATPEERDRLGDAGRRYFLEHFEMRRQAQKLIEILHRRGVQPQSDS
jgi:glycosyltransferase involved in cell wall biosynthesis